MSAKIKKIGLVGGASTGAGAPEALAARTLKQPKTVFKEPGFKTDLDFKQPTFKTQDELDNFLKETKHIFLKKTPKMPFRLLKDYVSEYMLIYKKKSRLTGTQRAHVKNIVHYNLRKGTIILK